jgi:hypothetical protein
MFNKNARSIDNTSDYKKLKTGVNNPQTSCKMRYSTFANYSNQFNRLNISSTSSHANNCGTHIIQNINMKIFYPNTCSIVAIPQPNRNIFCPVNI